MSTEHHRNETLTVKVTIYNQHYNLRAADSGEYIEQVANLVDARMHEVSDHLHTVDSLKIAVLAALNIADELCRVQRLLQQQNPEPSQKVAEPEQQATHGYREEKGWSYEDIFESLPSRRSTPSRMADQVANRLQSLRQASQDRLTILTDGEEV